MIYLCIVIYITISHVQSDHHQYLVIDAKFAHAKVLEQNIMNNEKVGVVRLGYNHEIYNIKKLFAYFVNTCKFRH